MTQTYDEPECHILVIATTDEHITVAPPNLHGPFESLHDAQVYARDWREAHDIPGHENVQPTSEENEAWTDAGWYFGIFTPIELTREQMYAEAVPADGYLITVQREGEDVTTEFATFLREADELDYGNRPKNIGELKHALGCVFSRTFEWNDENEAAMKPWYEAADALDEESYFPVHMGPTPDGVTILVKKGPDA